MTSDPTKTRKSSDAANHYAARLLQHLVVPTFVIDADRRVVVWNRACERLTGIAATEVLGTRNHWQAFYEDDRYCLADLVALGRLDLIGDLYSEFVATKDDSIGSSAENWCMMPRLGNHLYLAIDAGPILDDDGNLIAVVETLRDMTEHKRAEMALKTLAARMRSRASPTAAPSTRPSRSNGRARNARGGPWRCCSPTSIISSCSTTITAINAATNVCATSPG